MHVISPVGFKQVGKPLDTYKARDQIGTIKSTYSYRHLTSQLSSLDPAL